MAHWDAFYQRWIHDTDYPSLSTTISAGASQFNPADLGRHAVANSLGAFTTASQPLMQPHDEDDSESGSEFASRPNIIMLIFTIGRRCACVCVYVLTKRMGLGVALSAVKALNLQSTVCHGNCSTKVVGLLPFQVCTSYV